MARFWLNFSTSAPHKLFPHSDFTTFTFVTVLFACPFTSQATKIHQRAFGNDHPITARSLELMATVYAEIGKTEYSGKHKANVSVLLAQPGLTLV